SCKLALAFDIAATASSMRALTRCAWITRRWRGRDESRGLVRFGFLRGRGGRWVIVGFLFWRGGRRCLLYRVYPGVIGFLPSALPGEDWDCAWMGV
ncbi:MAG: hypothetical protein BRC51_05070, partial [Cyanobacteria bacterium SW_12_48_29]